METAAIDFAKPRRTKSSSRRKHGGEGGGRHGNKEAGEGMSDDAIVGMFLLTLMFAGLAVWALWRAGDDPPVTVVWRLSLLVSGYLAFCVGALSGAGPCAAVFRVAYAALAVFAVGSRLSAGAGMAGILLVAVCVAGFFGFHLAV